MGIKKCVNKIALDGSVVEKYASAMDAAKSNGLSKAQITRCCSNNKKVINGFKYEYTGEISNRKERSTGDFKCPYCHLSFQSYISLARHATRSHKKTPEELLADYKYGGVRPTCKCGCGRETMIDYETKEDDGIIKFRDFVRGHQSRVKNNWGHNDKAKEKSASTRREQYKSGERIQWNKGLSYEEAYGHEKAQELSSAISERLFAKIRENKFTISSNLEGIFEKEFLDSVGIDYERQLYLKDIKQYCDFFIPSRNTVIEVDGTFWHADPRFYPHGPSYDVQKLKKEKDIVKDNFLKEKNISILRFWENDINNDKKSVKEKIYRSLKPQESLDEFVKSLGVESSLHFLIVDLEADNEHCHASDYFLELRRAGNILIYEDEWRDKHEIVESRIKNLLSVTPNKIYARKCQIREVSYLESKEFLEHNHLQGNSSNGKIRLGLYFNDELVSLMTFCSLRKNLGQQHKDGEFELLRFCNKCGCTVVGGASKLFKTFIERYTPSRVISYSDKRWGCGAVYYALGMDLTHTSSPSYYYVIQRKRYNRFGFRKDKLIKEGFDESMSEHEIMESRGIHRIYDCGADVFELKISQPS